MTSYSLDTKFETSSAEFQEIERVKQQIKAEVSALQTNTTKETLFYSKTTDGKIVYDMNLVKNYLTELQDRTREGLTTKNSSAWIMAVQIALKSMKYDIKQIDGMFWDDTKKQVAAFQKAHKLKIDGQPWKSTIQAILKELEDADLNNTNIDPNKEGPTGYTEALVQYFTTGLYKFTDHPAILKSRLVEHTKRTLGLRSAGRELYRNTHKASEYGRYCAFDNKGRLITNLGYVWKLENGITDPRNGREKLPRIDEEVQKIFDRQIR